MLPTAEEQRLPSPEEDLRIAGDLGTLLALIKGLYQERGLKPSNLIVGIDFTRSNTWTGRCSFSNDNLHDLGNTLNPYEQTIAIIGQALSEFSEDNLIYCFGFGDVRARDKDVFPFYINERPCRGHTEALKRYRELVPHVEFDGPTSYAPLIKMATTIVEQSGGQHHVLLIVADGQEAVRIDDEEQVKIKDQKTIDAITSASNFPLSIVLVGVGDNSWDMTMTAFERATPSRAFDNFQFVNFSEIMSKYTAQTTKEAAFAYAALSKIPQQLQEIMKLRILGRQNKTDTENFGLSLPPYRETDVATRATTILTCGFQTCNICNEFPEEVAFRCGHKFCGDCQRRVDSCPNCREKIDTRITIRWHENLHIAAPSGSTTDGKDVCPACPVNSANTRDMVFGCGHMTCSTCGPCLESCLICDCPITTRIQLY